MKILKIFIVIFAITIASFIGFGIRSRILDNKIKSLTNTYNIRQATVDNIYAEINISDAQSERDRAFLEMMFSEIFTFYDIDDFKAAKDNAKHYGLSDDFINRFYDMGELNDSAYAEAMLDVLCKYESSDLYLIERRDNIGYYIAVVTLDTVKYNNSFDIVLFLTLADSGEENDRVKSIIYYNT